MNWKVFPVCVCVCFSMCAFVGVVGVFHVAVSVVRGTLIFAHTKTSEL